MKNQIRNLVLFAVIVMAILAQPVAKAQQKPFKFGFKISPAVSWLSPDANTYESGGSGFTFAWGFVSDFTLMDNYYLSTGFNMSYFQGKLKYPHIYEDDNEIDYEGNLSRTYNLRYIEVPLALKMKTNELMDNFLFFGLIGVNTGFKIRAKANDEFIGYDELGSKKNFAEEKIDIRDEARAVKVSLLVGAGMEYVVDESVSVVLGLNFNNGFTNVIKGDNSVDGTIEARAIPYYFELNLGVIF